MKCTNCRLDKLSQEFPSDIISQKCSHVSTFCLRCIIKHLDQQPNQSQQKCPECKVILSRQEVKDLNLVWNKSPFRVYIENISELKKKNKDNLNQNGEINHDAKGDFYVVLLNGTKLKFKLENIKSVWDLKVAIKEQTNVEVNKQKLIYKGVELQVFSTQRIKSQLFDYSIVAESHIQLMVLLYSISKELSINALTFDLFWGFPQDGSVYGDYLDGSCILYTGNGSNSQPYRTIDYSKRQFNDNMSHSGDVMDSQNRRGHHRITANLASMPCNVSKLYFILSAYRSPNIGCFPNPSFRMFDPSNPSVQLCSYTIQSAANSKAVIMCIVEKSEEGNWNIFEIGKLSDGNVTNYQPIINTINNMDHFE